MAEEVDLLEKNVLLFAPAGSGKTESLARRYVALLKKGIPPERILALTFTEDAAAQMKDRIMTILRKDHRELYQRIRPQSVRMRISTFHSFLRNFLLRFSNEAEIEFGHRVAESSLSTFLFERALLEYLRGVTEENRESFLKVLSYSATYETLRKLLVALYKYRPKVELLLYGLKDPKELVNEEIKRILTLWKRIEDIIKEKVEDFDLIKDLIEEISGDSVPQEKQIYHIFDILNRAKITTKTTIAHDFLKELGDRKDSFRENGEEFLGRIESVVSKGIFIDYIFPIFTGVYDRFTGMKREKGLIDFADMEFFSIVLLRTHPEIMLALYDFDESTDHILVDEFQDTNFIQWEVITHLTEEWRSGRGAKAEVGIKPTIYLVGDDKQAIFGFRGANVAVFKKAQDDLREWFGDGFIVDEKEENYRSLPAIVDFVNEFFQDIMKGGGKPWLTEYKPFVSQRREARGTVSLILYDGKDWDIHRRVKREGELLAGFINYLLENESVYHEGVKRKIKLNDIAILLRKKTHLATLQKVLRKNGIPSYILKGSGFYQEPEIILLKDLLLFLEDPTYDLGLYRFLFSPWGKELLRDPWVDAFFEGGEPLIYRLLSKGRHRILDLLKEGIEKRDFSPLHWVMRGILREVEFYRYFPDPQEQANMEKFFEILVGIESRESSWSNVAREIKRLSKSTEEGFALLEEAGREGVKFITIHSAKGLEFPVVILAGLAEKEQNTRKGDWIEILEGEERPRVLMKFKNLKYSEFLKLHPIYGEIVERENEELKRLLYVALTRARDHLAMVSPHTCKGVSKNSLWYLLKDGLELENKEGEWVVKKEIMELEGFRILKEEEVASLAETKEISKGKSAKKPPVWLPDPLKLEPKSPWIDVTEEIREKDKTFLEEWNPYGSLFGEVVHKTLYSITLEGEMIDEKRLREKLEEEFRRRKVGLHDISVFVDSSMEQLEKLKESGLLDRVVLGEGSDDSWPEMSFFYREGDKLYKGRIDRVLVYKDRVEIYDYKTFPVKEEKIGEVIEHYKSQLEIYKKALKSIFREKEVHAFILLTALPKVVEV